MTPPSDNLPYPSMRDIPNEERPRERLLAQGAAALSTAELLAIIIGTGTSQENVLRLSERLLAHYGGLHNLAQASPTDLRQIKGIGSAKITQIVAAFEIGRRLMTRSPEERPLISSAADAAQLVLDMRDLTQEHVRLLLLDSSRRVVAIPTVYIGTLNASVLRISEIFRDAITRNCPAFILAHNHPSGDPNPSPEDVELTRAIVSAGHLLDITLLDHIIIGHRGWVSLKDLKLGFV
jgi:DNA repair protein RadC